MTRADSAAARLATRLRSAVALGPTLLWRRARRDAPLLVAWTLLAAITIVLALAGPRLLTGTVDAGAREAVATAGSLADIHIHSLVGVQRPSDQFRIVYPSDFAGIASDAIERLPRAIRQVTAGHVVTVLGPQASLIAHDAEPRLTASGVKFRMAMLNPQNLGELSIVKGTVPPTSEVPSGDPIGVVLSEQAAKASSLDVGSVVTVPIPNVAGNSPPLRVVVTGIVTQNGHHANPSVWSDLPAVWNPHAGSTPAFPSTEVIVLAQPNGINAAAGFYLTPFDGTVRVRLDPAAFTGDSVEAVSSAIEALVANSSTLVAASNATLDVNSPFANALVGYASQARAATSQISVVLVGILGVSLAVLILLSRLLVSRRAGEIDLQRSRGAAASAIVARFIVESVLACAVAVALGLAVAAIVAPGPVAQPIVLASVIVAQALAAPVQASALIARSRVRRTSSVQRRERLERQRRDLARRITVEAFVIALAVAAVVSLRSRGLLQTTTAGIDPLLSAAPLLVSAAITVVALRIYPWPVRLAGFLGRRTRGPLGLLGAVRARHSVTVLPLLALTLAVALTAASALIGATVRSGQQDAAWQRVGADVRVDGAISEAQVARVADAPGVDAAASFLSNINVHLALSSESVIVTMLAVDHGYPDVVHALPRIPGLAQASASGALRELASAGTPDGRLPVVVGPELANKVKTKDMTMSVGEHDIPVRVIGDTGAGPDGYLDGPFVYVDLASLSTMLSRTVTADSLLVVGAGATRAVADAHIPHATVHTRAGWITSWNGQAMVSGVQNILNLSAWALGLLALVALVATVLAGAGERARSLSLVRTLGMPLGLGWWLALAELAPLAIAAVIGGVASGLAIVLFLGPALGLITLSGGLYAPATTVSWWFILWLVVASVIVVAVAVFVEVLLRRRDRVSEVLRVGETV
jgi:putative ABC transport system permease protein